MFVSDRRRILSVGAMLAAGLMMSSALAQGGSPALSRMAGTPSLMLASYDLADLGYVVEEYALNGTARSYQPAGDFGADGHWRVQPAASADYTTRIVVVRPTNSAKFKGTIAVEWLNVSLGQDFAAGWVMTHREILRNGYAYVGVSAQKVGIDGGASLSDVDRSLKAVNPDRYARLRHPGDAFSFDIFSQAGRAVRDGAQRLGLAGSPIRMLAIGQSQSAAFLTTYINAIANQTNVYQGFLIHSRFGSSAPLAGGSIIKGASSAPVVRFRTDGKAPIMVVETETDVIGLSTARTGYLNSRQPDDARLRIWEIAGAAHADNYIAGAGFIDSGRESAATLAAAFKPTSQALGMKLQYAMNNGPQQRYAIGAAFLHLDRWVGAGKTPPSVPPLAIAPTGKDGMPAFSLDTVGNARGGLRTPWVDVPTSVLSGIGNSGSALAPLVGTVRPFTPSQISAAYPGGKATYSREFATALDRAIAKGYILASDRSEILALAEELYAETSSVSAQ